MVFVDAFQMIDMISFIVILLVFIIAYGMAIQIILYPNTAFDRWMIKRILSKAYFQIYGELFLEELEGVFYGSILSST